MLRKNFGYGLYLASFLLIGSWFLSTNIPGSIFLLNDSPYILTASVYASNGEFLGESTLQPGQQSKFTYNFSPTYLQRPGSPAVSITPYRVVWKCPEGSVYSMCPGASTAALIRATDCPGPWRCEPSPKTAASDQRNYTEHD